MDFSLVWVVSVALLTAILILASIIRWHSKWTLEKKRLAEVFRKHEQNPDMIRNAETRQRVLKRVMQVIIAVVAIGLIIYVVPPLRTLSVSLLAGAGIAAIIIGFAIQKSFSNIFAGIFIALYEPFRIGDYIAVGEKVGIVEDITLHHTVLREWRQRRFVIPNSTIFETIIENYTLGNNKLIKTVEIYLAYETDVDKARAIVLKELENDERILHEEPPRMSVVEWTDRGYKARIAFWVTDPLKGFAVEFSLLEKLAKKFRKAGIQIPVQQVRLKR